MDHKLGLDEAAPVKLARDYSTQESSTTPVEPTLLAYQQLLDLFLAGTEGPEKRQRLWAVQIWCDAVGAVPADIIGTELTKDFDAELSRVRNDLEKAKSSKTAANFSSLIRGFRARYFQWMHGAELPVSLAGAIQFRLKALGLEPHFLDKAVSQTAYLWAKGKNFPASKKGSTIETLHKIEEVLGLPLDSLVVRAGYQIPQIRDMSKDIPHRRYIGIITRHKYILPTSSLPEALCDSLEELVQFKQRTEQVLPDGEVKHLAATETWNSPATIKSNLKDLYHYFGFLTLPKASSPIAKMPWEERIGYGLGLPVESLRLSMLFNLTYIRAYFDFWQLRTFDSVAFQYDENLKNGKAVVGSPPLRRTLPSSALSFTKLLCNLVSKSHSFFRLHPRYAEDLDVPLEKWDEFCTTRHKDFIKIQSVVTRKVENAKRSNNVVLDTLLREENPLAAVHELLVEMRRAPPPNNKQKTVQIHYRDICLISFLLFEPLRCKNLVGLMLDKHLTKSNSGQWLFSIDAKEKKNYIWGHAQTRERTLPVQVAQDLDNWLEHRKNLPYAMETDQVFCNMGRGRHVGTATLEEAGVYGIIARRTKQYLGLSFGPHAFRNLGATAVSRVGTPMQVKALLDDSEAIALKIYNGVKNMDEFRALDDIYLDLSKPSKKGGTK